MRGLIVLALLSGSGCSSTRVIVRDCIDLDPLGKYKSCEAVVSDGVGERCGGIAGIACRKSLVCRPDNPLVVDGFGTCVKE